jgi:hypothetical protein
MRYLITAKYGASTSLAWETNINGHAVQSSIKHTAAAPVEYTTTENSQDKQEAFTINHLILQSDSVLNQTMNFFAAARYILVS